jgi:hypothetical protein
VYIEQVIADRRTYDATIADHLPPHIRDVEIDYTALSLVAPEKNRFKYKLEDYDRDWQDVGNRRQAFYTNLPPRGYTGTRPAHPSNFQSIQPTTRQTGSGHCVSLRSWHCSGFCI